MGMTKLIHLDTDIGGDTDDLCALVMLLGMSDVGLSGVTTSAEVDGWRAGIARYALRLAGRDDVPVAAGAAGTLGQFPSPPGLHDNIRYWPEPLMPFPGPPGAALDLLAASIAQGATVAAIGPYTNLAVLEAMRPGSLAGAKVVLMGGLFGPLGPGLPSWGIDFDWNVQCDAVAARTVLERCRPLIVPINVTVQVALRAAHLPALRASGSLGRLLALQAEEYARDSGLAELAKRYDQLPNDLLNFQHDALACAVAAGWDGVTVEDVTLSPGLHGRWLSFERVIDGWPARVVTSVDAARFAADWLAAIQRADHQIDRGWTRSRPGVIDHGFRGHDAGY